MKPFLISFFIFVFTMFLGDVQSQTLYVDSAIVTSGNGSSWSNAFKSLGRALDSASNNSAVDSILVAKGTYNSTNSTSIFHSSAFHIRAGLEVYGGYPNGGGMRNISANPTILSGATATDSFIHVVLMGGSSSADTSVLNGFTIEKGRPAPSSGWGPIIPVAGGGIYINGGTNLISHCTIRKNRAGDFGDGIASYNSNTTIQNCIIDSNLGTNQGTAIYLWGGNYLISNNIIQNHIGNVVYSFRSKVNFIGNLVTKNLWGNAISFFDSSSKIVNNIIANNSGGTALQTTAGVHYIENNTISSNGVNTFFTGGFFTQGSAINYLRNNIFWGNKNPTGYADSLYSDIRNGGATIIANNNLFQIDSTLISTIPLAAGSTKNLYKINPLFKGGTGADSLALLPTSPLLDKGDSSLYTWTEKLDFLGADRIQNSNIDIGAIETYNCVSKIDVYDTICFGDTLSFAGNILKLGGVYYDTLTNISSCDSFVTFNLFVLNCTRDTSVTTKACASIDIGGFAPVYSSAGVTMSVYCRKGSVLIKTNGSVKYMPNTNFVGRDTINRVICITNGATTRCDTNYIFITVLPQDSSILNTSICNGASYSFNGNNLTSAGVYRDTLIATNGCDSLIILNLTIKPTSSSTINSTICKGMTYLFNGLQRSTSGVYKDTFASSNGCDSIVTLNLTISSPPVITTTDSSDFATAYTWRGKTYSSAGTYYDTSKAANKCDTIFKLILSAKAALPPAAPPILQINYVAGALIASIDSANSYQWYLCGPPMKKITGATKRTFQVSDKNKYTVVVTKNGKTDTAACASNSFILSTNFAQGIICYPNPVFNKLSIELERKLSNVDITIYDLSGRILWGQHFNSLLHTEISMQNLPEGTYFLQMQSDQVSHRVIKIVKRDE
ncbi:MAG: T9SS type A sorting domain-containing protein [Chitinophagales bacterium]|jgi:hypothetical protein|nr:right-handed parallel beta-helix repeat-containing protein [Sphingobacteriales bacterium]